VWRGRPRSRLGKDSEVRASPELIHSLPDYVSGSLSIAQMVKNRHSTHVPISFGTLRCERIERSRNLSAMAWFRQLINRWVPTLGSDLK
jgi:hypothetical protein